MIERIRKFRKRLGEYEPYPLYRPVTKEEKRAFWFIKMRWFIVKWIAIPVDPMTKHWLAGRFMRKAD